MPRREYTAGRPTTLTAALSIGATSFTIADATNWPTSTEYDFWVTVDGGTAQEERILCSARTGTTVTVATRGADGTSESNHAAGATIWPSWSATDADEANAHVYAVTNIHGVSGALAPLNAPTFTGTVVLPSTTSIGSVSSTELSYVDGVTSAIQTQLNTIVNTTIPAVIPTGVVNMWVTGTAPTGWLICDGSTKSTTTNPELANLYSVIGTTYGGTGASSFKLPDLRGRVPMGAGTGRNVADSADLTARTLGTKVSDSQTVTLTQAQTPSFNHEFQIAAGGGDGTTYFRGSSGGYSTSFYYSHGSGEAHENTQPSTVINFIIKT